MFNQQFSEAYLQQAPLPLALERIQECLLLSEQQFNQPILDIGCGDGLFASILFKQKIDVGIDPNAQELECAKLTNAYDELLECYGHSIPKPDKSFKTIFSNSVMEHIPDIKPVLMEAHRLLADDGKLYLTLPTNLFERYTLIYQLLAKCGLQNLAERYSKFFNKFWRHYHFYDAKGWRNLFEQSGFHVEYEQEYGTKKNCMFHDVMVIWSLPSFIAKKMFNRWFWLPGLRKKYANFLKLRTYSESSEIMANPGEGGLIFFVLSKK